MAARTQIWRALLAEASGPYRKAGWFAYFFARGKFSSDPVYHAILERGLLHGRARILDLGCGQALLSAWLQGAIRVAERGLWPAQWRPPPRPEALDGIELMPRDVARARAALGTAAHVIRGDIRHAEFAPSDAIVLLDVLHYLSSAAQRDLLLRIRGALPPRGLLLMRVNDSGAGLRARYTQWVDRLSMYCRGHAWAAPQCRGVEEWRRVLHECGFDSEAQPMSQGTPFANVLLIALARPP